MGLGLFKYAAPKEACEVSPVAVLAGAGLGAGASETASFALPVLATLFTAVIGAVSLASAITGLGVAVLVATGTSMVLLLLATLIIFGTIGVGNAAGFIIGLGVGFSGGRERGGAACGTTGVGAGATVGTSSPISNGLGGTSGNSCTIIAGLGGTIVLTRMLCNK